MTTRIHDMPVYASRTVEVEAPLYGLWRRARLHLPLPLRYDLPGMKQMTLIIEDDHWAVVDHNQYDLPILAWLDFQDSDRDSLHTPVTCTVNYYHFMANQLQEKVLQRMSDYLEDQLHQFNDGQTT